LASPMIRGRVYHPAKCAGGAIPTATRGRLPVVVSSKEIGPPSGRPPLDAKLKETDMSTAPIIAPLPATWAGQLPELLKKYRNFATRAEAINRCLDVPNVP
jgi:hypothetical protein